jgi:hypothetical protein
MMAEKKSDSYRSFEELTKRLLKVPKEELDRRMGEYERRKQAKRTAASRPAGRRKSSQKR